MITKSTVLLVVYINFEIFLPSIYKFDMACILVCICFLISSDWKELYAELPFLKTLFCKNDYPENFIDKCFKKFPDNIRFVKDKVPTVERKRLLLVLP